MLLYALIPAALASSTASIGLSPLGGGLSSIHQTGVLGVAHTPTAALGPHMEVGVDGGISLYSLDATLQGADKEHSSGMVPMPFAGAVLPFERVGLGAYAMLPYGGGAEFSETGAQRFHAINARSYLFETGLLMAMKVTDGLRLGASFRAGRGSLKRRQAIDTAALVNSKSSLELPIGAPLFEGSQELDLVGWGYGFGLGLSVQLPHDSQLHLAYRSPLAVEMSGAASLIPSNDLELELNGSATTKMQYAQELDLGLDIPVGPIRAQLYAGWADWRPLATIEASLTDLQIESEDVTTEQLLLQLGINESELLEAGTDVTNDLGHTPAVHGGLAVKAQLSERWTIQPGVFYSPTTLPDETFHIGIVDFSAWDLRGAVAWTPVDWLTTGFSVDYFVVESRNIQSSKLSLENSAASGRVLPSANGRYSMTASRYGLTLIARK